jgi:hypothetical protein
MMMKSRREGFALPLALFVIAFVTVGVAASFNRVENEERINRDRDAAVDAYRLAESGLQYILTNRKALGLVATPPLAAESVRITLPGGHADVIVTRVRPVLGVTVEALYLVRSRGSAQQGSAQATPLAQHTVTQYAVFRPATMQVRSAWTSLTGLTKNGGSGTIDGSDDCGLMPAVAGVSVPDNNGTIGGYIQSGGAPVPGGNPPIESLGPVSSAGDSIKVDWDGIINNNVLTFDYVVPTPDAWPTFTDPNFWPLIRVDGNYSLPTSGQGLLVASGDLTINGGLSWDGVILVGGTLTADGTNQVRGAVISGLNTKLGMSVPRSDVGNGTKTFVYNSCTVASAMGAMGTLVVVPGTWNDNWPW